MIQFSKGMGENALTAPVDRAQIRSVKESGFVSLRVGDSHGIPLDDDLCNPTRLQEALDEILEVREMVERDEFPRAFMGRYYPGDWGEFPDEIPAPLAHASEVFHLDAPLSFDDPKGLAQVVRMDHPIDFGRVLIDWLLDNGAKPKIRATGHFDFVEVVAGSMSKLMGRVYHGLNEVFEVKWEHMVARPEEVAGKNITAYPEGCPGHPSYPAGHGRAAFDTIGYFFDEWDMSDEQKKAIFDAAYVWAMSRSLAGVHYGVDNVAYVPRRSEA